MGIQRDAGFLRQGKEQETAKEASGKHQACSHGSSNWGKGLNEETTRTVFFIVDILSISNELLLSVFVLLSVVFSSILSNSVFGEFPLKLEVSMSMRAVWISFMVSGI